MAIIKRSAITPAIQQAMDTERAERDIGYAAYLMERQHLAELKKEVEYKGQERRASYRGHQAYLKIACKAPGSIQDCVVYRGYTSDMGTEIKGYLGRSKWADVRLDRLERASSDLGIRPGELSADDAAVWAGRAGALTGAHYFVDIRSAESIPAPDTLYPSGKPRQAETMKREEYRTLIASDNVRMRNLALKMRMAQRVV